MDGFSFMYNECMPLISECFPCILSMLIFSLYIVSFTECLNGKVDQLSVASEQLSNALQTREKFISNISHEFRTVCLSSLGSIELLKDTNSLTAEQKELLENVECSNGMILSVIEDILHFARTENISTHQPNNNRRHSQSDMMTLDFELASCLRTIYNIIRGYCKPLKVHVELELSEDIGENLLVHGSQSSLQQCLINLLSNAAKASKKGQTITLRCGLSKQATTTNDHHVNPVVGKKCSSSRQWFEFKVIDHGKGIETQYLNMLFQPFVQLNSFSNCGIPGTGLGLSNVRNNVSFMGGKISVQSQVGKGSTFTLMVPFQVVSNNEKVVPSPSVEKEANAEHEVPATCSGSLMQRRRSTSISQSAVISNLSRQMEFQKTYVEKYMSAEKENRRRNSTTLEHPQILIAEDNAINRMIIIRLLKNVGFEAEAVCNAQQLLERFNPNYHRLIITDLNMPPGMDGLQAAQEIRKLCSNKHEKSPAIILLTGDGFSDHSDDIERGIIDMILLKPCNKEDLKNAVSQFLH
ncbi:hypothetical protein C9374_013348 [Naegleria lovaniensis]|uniref:histidine kinase n=1 Tax=Naegleria lovaniensis TaxID=51637 RepID=A0AA88GVL2_NAELO|nr:uncharacterized protein C9374_013348 [Naegleria lovaniensis]KAG2391863.1 hypothetical protein C9374_013348 [Naegleria lovaniensis]